MNKINCIIIFISCFFIFLSSCDNHDSDFRKFALAYFIGDKNIGYENMGSGKMISSWEGKKKQDAINIQKIIYGLNDDWRFYDENIDVKEINKSEFFITYEIIFAHKNNSDFYHVEEQYFSTSEIYEDPVPLKVTEMKINIIDEKKTEIVKEHTLWKGDFDAYLSRHLTRTVSPEKE